MKTWMLQDAKAKFSQLVGEALHNGPQLVTRRGEEAVVVLAAKEYQGLTRRQSLVEFFKESPLSELPDAAFERDQDAGRDLVL